MADSTHESDSSLFSIPSSPLSELSRSPSPPMEFRGYPPSPPSSQQSQIGSPAPDEDKDGQPPAKRRKKERTTEYLDLSSQVSDAQRPQLERVLRVIHKRKKIVAVAGAGISVSAGIPDFRSSNGLFTSLKSEHKLKGSGKDLFDASVYADDDSTTHFHSMVSSMSRMTKGSKPTQFHHMLATLAQEDRLLRLYSQNVDSIDTNMEPLQTSIPLRKNEEGKWPKTVQLHGSLDKMVCSKCHELTDLDATLFEGPTPPACKNCVAINNIRTDTLGKRSHGIGCLRPRMVLYNEHNPDDEAIGRVAREDLRRRPDAVIVVGTTLKVPGVKRIVREMCNTVRDHRDGVAIWINNDPPPSGLENCWDIIIKGPADAVAAQAGLRRWDEKPAETVESTELDDSDSSELIIPLISALPAQPLPSAAHHNNSFKAPADSANRHAHHEVAGSPEFSPMKPRHLAIVQEDMMDGRGAVVNGLLTPTKSVGDPIDKESVPFGLDGKKQAPAAKSKAKTAKKKPVKKAASKTKAQQSQNGQQITSMLQSKKHAIVGPDHDNIKTEQIKSLPSTPRRTNAAQSIDFPHNILNTPKRPLFPGLASKSDGNAH